MIQYSDFDALINLESLIKCQYSLFYDRKNNFLQFTRDSAVKIFKLKDDLKNQLIQGGTVKKIVLYEAQPSLTYYIGSLA